MKDLEYIGEFNGKKIYSSPAIVEGTIEWKVRYAMPEQIAPEPNERQRVGLTNAQLDTLRWMRDMHFYWSTVWDIGETPLKRKHLDAVGLCDELLKRNEDL